MAFMKKGIIDLKGILFLMLLTVTSQATNLDCYGKAFHCVNSTHFMICVDLGRGTSTTIDDVVIPCPSPTVCRMTNRFECEFLPLSLPSSTVATTELATTVTLESVTTFSPLSSTSIPYGEYFDTVSTTTLSQAEQQPSPADTPLSVNPIIGVLDTSSSTTTEKVIPSHATTETVVGGNFSTMPSDISVSNVESNKTSNFNVIPNDVASPNQNKSTDTQTPLTKPTLHTQFENVGNLTSDYVISTESGQLIKSENVFTTEFGSTTENITETVIINSITEVPVIVSSTSIPTVTEQTVTVGQNFSTKIEGANTIDNSTLLDTTTLLEPTHNVNQINESQSVGDVPKNASANFNTRSEVSLNATTIEVTSAVPDQTVNTEQDFSIVFQKTTSAIDNSTLLYTTVLLEATQSDNPINESQLVGDKAVGFNGISVNASTTDVKSAVPVNTKQESPKVLQEAVNATTTDIFLTFPDTTTPLESTQSVKNVNTSQSVKDTTKHLTENFTNVSITQDTTTSISTAINRVDTRVTESPLLNSKQNNTFGNKKTHIIASSELTGNVEIIFTKDLTEPLVNITNISYINTEAPVYTTLTDIMSVITEQTATKDIVSVEPLNMSIAENVTITTDTPLNMSIAENVTITTDTTSIQPQTDIINTSKLVNRTTDSGFAGFMEKNVNKDNKADTVTNMNEFNSRVTGSLSKNNLESMTPTELSTAYINTVSETDNLSYDETFQTTTTAGHTLNYSSFATEHIVPLEQGNKFINGSVSEIVSILDTKSTTDAVVTMANKTSDVLDTYTNNYNKIGKYINPNNTSSDKNKNEYFTAPSTVLEVVTESQFTSSKHFESDLTNHNTTIATTKTEEPLKIKPSGNVTISTIKPNLITEAVTTISFNNLEELTNTSTIALTSDLTTEKKTNDPQSDAESFGYDIDRVGNKTNKLTQNEKVSTNDAYFKPSTQAYKSDSKSRIESSTPSALVSESSTTIVTGPQTESAILSSVSLLPETALTENSLSINSMNQINSDTSTMSHDNKSVIITDEQNQTVTSRLSTPLHNVTDTSHVDSLQSSVQEHTDKTMSLDILSITATEVTILSPPTVIGDQNNTQSSEATNTPTRTVTIPINVSTSMPSTTMEITDTTVAYISPDYTSTEKNISLDIPSITATEVPILSAPTVIGDRNNTQSSETTNTPTRTVTIQINVSTSMPSTTMEMTDTTVAYNSPDYTSTEKNISLDIPSITASEVTILSPLTVIGDQNNTQSSEATNTSTRTVTLPINISTSLPSTTMEITDNTVPYILPDYTSTEKNKNVYDAIPLDNMNDQTGNQTMTAVFQQSTNSNKLFVTNTAESTLIDVKGNAQNITEPNNNDAVMKSTISAHALLGTQSTADPTLETITSNITESILMGTTTVDSSATGDKTNAYLPFSSDLSLSTTVKDLLDNSTLTLDVIQTNNDQIVATTEGNITSSILTEFYNASNTLNLNVQSSTKIPITAYVDNSISNKNNVSESMPVIVTESYLEQINKTFESTLTISSDLAKNNLDSSVFTRNTTPDLNSESSTAGYSEATALVDNRIGIRTNIPAIQNIATLNKNSVNEKTSTESNVIELFSSPNLATTIKDSILSTNTQRNLNTIVPTQAYIRDTVSTGAIKTPMIVNTVNTQNSTKERDSLNENPTEVYVNVRNVERQTNPMENINLLSLATSQNPLTPTNHPDLYQSIVVVEEKTEETLISSNPSTSDSNMRTTSAFNSKSELPHTLTVAKKLNSEVSSDLIVSQFKKQDEQPLIVDSKTSTTAIRPLSFILPVTSHSVTAMHTNDDLNAPHSDSLQTQITSDLITVSQIVTKYVGKEVHGVFGTTETLLNQDHDKTTMDSISSADNAFITVTQQETANLNPTSTKPILTRDLDILLKQTDSTVSGVNADILNTESIQSTQKNAVGPSTIVKQLLHQTKPLGSFIDNKQVSQTPTTIVIESKISTTYPSRDFNRQASLKATEMLDHIPNTDLTGQVRRDLINAHDSPAFKDHTKTHDIILAATTVSTRKPTESSIREANTNIGSFEFNTDRENPDIRSEATKLFTVQTTRGEDKSTSSSRSPDFGVPTEVITTSDVLVDSNVGGQNTHSGIISLITQSPKFSDTKEKPENEETEKEEQHKAPIYVEQASPQDKVLFKSLTDIPNIKGPLNDYSNRLLRDISTREELLIQTKNDDFQNNGSNSEQFLSTKISMRKNIHNDTNTTVSEYKTETPTYELIENSAPALNDSHTSNSKSQDQNMSIPQAHNKSVISKDQSSTSRNISQTISTAAVYTQTTGFPASESSTRKTELNKFSCEQKKRGRYADELDCRKFYICIGNKSSRVIEGTCPVNTVFSEINKQCTKNLSHCIRNNQFRCVTEGRFSDFLNDNVYYICVRNSLSHFMRFKLLCQNGYHLNKTSVRCVLNNEPTSTSESKSVSEQSSSVIKQDIKDNSEKKFKCKKEGLFPDPSNCIKYFECTKVDSSYRQKRKKCDSDEIFHKDKKKCVDADSYEC